MLRKICCNNPPCIRFVVTLLMEAANIDGDIQLPVGSPQAKHFGSIRVTFDGVWRVERLHWKCDVA